MNRRGVVVAPLWLSIVASSLVAAQPQAVDSLKSPALRATVAQVAVDAAAAERRFWENARATGLPIVEPFPGDPRFRFVTFAFRGDTSTRGALTVTLLNDQLANDAYYAIARMYRLHGTTIWFRTYRIPSDARVTYRIGPELETKTRAELSDAEWQRKLSVLSTDPFNPKSTPGTNGMESLVELPDAPAQPWVTAKAGVAKGSIDSVRVHSRVLGNDRTIKVYRSPGMARGERAKNMVVILDGDEVPEAFPATTILDNLYAAHKIGPTVAIMVGNADGARIRELWYSDAFANAIETEFVPAGRAFGPLPDCPARCAIAGRSLGGSAAAFVALRQPRLFGGAIAQSGGYHYPKEPQVWSAPQPHDALFDVGFPEGEWLAREFAAVRKVPLRIYLEAGTMEDVRYETRQRPRYAANTVLGAARHLRDVLIAKGYAVKYHEFTGTHRSVNWQGTFADGLLFVLRDR